MNGQIDLSGVPCCVFQGVAAGCGQLWRRSLIFFSAARMARTSSPRAASCRMAWTSWARCSWTPTCTAAPRARAGRWRRSPSRTRRPSSVRAGRPRCGRLFPRSCCRSGRSPRSRRRRRASGRGRTGPCRGRRATRPACRTRCSSRPCGASSASRRRPACDAGTSRPRERPESERRVHQEGAGHHAVIRSGMERERGGERCAGAGSDRVGEVTQRVDVVDEELAVPGFDDPW
jgi:hypothetical protein